MEMIKPKEDYSVSGNVSLAEASDRVLKQADTFLITDRHGDIRPLGFEQHGLFHRDTRFLSRCILALEGKSPPLLSSAVTEDNDLLSVDLTNPDIHSDDGTLVRTGTIHMNRSIFLWEGCCYERLRMMNYSLLSLEFSFSFEFEADFSDIFEVRGTVRRMRGEPLAPVVEHDHVVLSYRGLDRVTRTTRLDISPPPLTLSPRRATSNVKLGPRQAQDFFLRISCELEHEPARPKPFDHALGELRDWFQRLRQGECSVETSNQQFNEMLMRSRSDLNMMVTETLMGLYPYAGIPWYSTIFGRDGIITALETLWVNPDLARGVLGYLAAEQATELIPERDAEPGKILHEERKGEMAMTGEVPFDRYYGTVDATPLFVVLAARYYERTGDLDFLQRVWPNVERALQWIDAYGDQEGDGFVEYLRRAGEGLSNQGWKDSGDSVFHSDGLLATPPIALCEVQGYVYEAKIEASRLASVLGKRALAGALYEEAERLRENFLKTFWCDEVGMYGLALDNQKRLCRVRASNAGHALFSGIATEEHARILVQNLLGESFFSGWGIRTLASPEVRYNPMSYHNGSVWPHDNAIIAFGMGRYGFKEGAVKILSGLFDASLFFDLHRPPELFCGFKRSYGEGPTLYPVACHPQAWASGAIFLLLQACLGLSIQAPEEKILFDHPLLPPFLEEVTVKNLRVGSASIDVVLTRREGDVSINVVRRKGRIGVVITK